jgi:hypothetical protein
MNRNNATTMEGGSFSQSDPLLMEGRHAIFSERWIVCYVRVHSIRSSDRWCKARICAIPTRGLYGKNEIEIGSIREYLTFGKDIWAGHGYCHWALCFDPLIIAEVLRTAASFPDDWTYDPADPAFEARHAALRKPLREYEAREAPNPEYLYLKRHGLIR